MSKKLYIKTYGCQMNVYDSHKMADLMQPLGYELVDDYIGADMVVLNTCHIREKAAEKVYSELGRIRKQQKKQQNEMLVAVAGCVGQAEGEEIFKRAPNVNFVVGPQSYQTLPRLVTSLAKEKGVELEFEPEDKFDNLPEESRPQGVSAFLTVQEGCDKFCTFCVVPYTRGAEYSRPFAAVLDEAKRLVDQGALEINLLGQNVNAYHGDGKTLVDLIRELSKLGGLKRIRYTTSHPRDMSDELIAAHGEYEKLMPFLHLPVQAGSNRILEEMNRKHSRDFYFSIIERLSKARPDLAFSSDFIVGFPGETESEFEDTMDLVRRVGFAQCYSFKYSPRPGTPGSLKEQVAEEVKAERLARLQKLIFQQQLEYNKSFIGKRLEALLDRSGKFENQLLGKSPYGQSVHIPSPLPQGGARGGLPHEPPPNLPLRGREVFGIGNLVEVEILEAGQNSIGGVIGTRTSETGSRKNTISDFRVAIS